MTVNVVLTLVLLLQRTIFNSIVDIFTLPIGSHGLSHWGEATFRIRGGNFTPCKLAHGDLNFVLQFSI